MSQASWAGKGVWGREAWDESCPRQVRLGKVSWDESPRQAGLGELGPGGLKDRGRARSRREGLGRRLGGHFPG